MNFLECLKNSGRIKIHQKLSKDTKAHKKEQWFAQNKPLLKGAKR